MQSTGKLYEQKPEEVAPVIPAAASAGSSYASEFEYNDGLQSGGQSSGGGGPNAKSISSAQYFGDQNKNADLESKATLQKFSVSNIPHNVIEPVSQESNVIVGNDRAQYLSQVLIFSVMTKMIPVLI